MAEVIKYGAIYDNEFFEYLLGKKDLESTMKDIEKSIRRCCEIKAKIVEIDELDMGLRMILNFGHTLGHAIEKYYNYTKYTHGEAISIGMYEITKLGEKLGITEVGESEKIKKILENYNLPLEDEVKLEDLIEIMKTDKKNISGVLNFIFLSKIGRVEVKKVAEEEIASKLV